jgi:AraC-like DNA-binding protein
MSKGYNSDYQQYYFDSKEEFDKEQSRYGKIDLYTMFALRNYFGGDLNTYSVMLSFHCEYSCKASTNIYLPLQYSNTDLATEFHISEKTVKRIIKKLLDMQLITRIKIGKGIGGKSEYIPNREAIYNIVKEFCTRG